MSQHDLVIDNASGASVRADLNNALQALGSRQSGSSAPSTTYAHMLWVDTTNGVLKRRNAANSGWIVVETNDESFVLSRSSNTILGLSDKGKTVAATSTFTQTLTAAATLGDGWYVDFRNDGTGIHTLDPNSTEQINGATTLKIYPGECCRIVCNGSAFKALFLSTGPVVIGTATASSSSTVDFTSGIDSNFEKYEIELTDVVPATNGADLRLRVSQSGVFDSGGTSYAYTGYYNFDGGSPVAAIGSAAASAVSMALNCSTESTRSVNGSIDFRSPSGTSRRKKFAFDMTYEADGVGSTRVNGSGHFQNGVGAIDGVRFLFSSGNIASGTFTLRGYRRG